MSTITPLPVAHGHRVAVTEHANDRAYLRYGIAFLDADAWLIDHLQRATSCACDHASGRIYWRCPDRATIVTTFADNTADCLYILTVTRKRGNQPLESIA